MKDRDLSLFRDEECQARDRSVAEFCGVHARLKASLLEAAVVPVLHEEIHDLTIYECRATRGLQTEEMMRSLDETRLEKVELENARCKSDQAHSQGAHRIELLRKSEELDILRLQLVNLQDEHERASRQLEQEMAERERKADERMKHQEEHIHKLQSRMTAFKDRLESQSQAPSIVNSRATSRC